MPLKLRPADPFAEADAMARLLCSVESEPVTAEVVRDRQSKNLPPSRHHALVAEGPDSHIIGMATALSRPYDQPGQFGLQIVVDPAWRHQGVGATLYEAITLWCPGQGATSFNAEVRADCQPCLEFALRRGFAVERHQFEAVLNVPTFDAIPFAGRVEAVQATGIRFFTLAATDASESALRRLYDLNTTTGLDIPGNANDPIRSFEQFVCNVTGGYWFRPEGQIFAADGEKWVGMAAVGEIAPGAMYNMHTGVLRDYRGRGIAQAFKLLAIDYARRQGAHSIRTNNDSRNAPMIAINRKLGYRPEPGWYRMLLSVPAA